MSLPQMDAAQRKAFNTQVAALLRARWTNGQVADWAISAASGFGRFWTSRQHALGAVNATLDTLNAQIALQNKAVAAIERNLRAAAWRDIERDPLAHLIEAVGGTSRPDPKRGRRG